jgi:NAD(P)-dependent dehydrogenase (short-subunit alcohol dehydrogenase family)
MQLSNRLAIVTGGSSGIGRATAILLAKQGARVFTGDYQPRTANDEQFGGLNITQLACDVRVEAQVRSLVDRATSDGGGLHIVVSNAGIVLPKPIAEVTEAEWDACIDTNVKGAFLLCKHALPHLKKSGGGSVVFTSSNAGLLPRAHDPVYCTSKAALIMLAQALGLAHARDRIRFNAVCPGPVSDTGIMDDDLAAAANSKAAEAAFIAASPLAKAAGRMITPDEVAQAILYLVSDAAAMVTGTAIRIDGGKSLGVPPPG